jgi:hypothetical protein
MLVTLVAGTHRAAGKPLRPNGRYDISDRL